MISTAKERSKPPNLRRSAPKSYFSFTKPLVPFILAFLLQPALAQQQGNFQLSLTSNQVVISQASFNPAPDSNYVSRQVTVDLLVSRRQNPGDAVWQPNLCFEVKVANPYANPDDYSSFKSQTPPLCQSTSKDVTATCNLKTGTTDTLQFRFPSIAAARTTNTMLSLSITNFFTPFSAQTLGITFQTYSDESCTKPVGAAYTAQSKDILGTIMPYSSVSVTGSSNQLGNNKNNSLIVQFTPLTTMAPGKSGSIKITIPFLYSTVPSFDETQVDTCQSTCMNIYSSKLVGETALMIAYNQMTSACLQNVPITINCRGYQNPIYQDQAQWGFTVTTYDAESKQSQIEVSGISYIDSTKFSPMIIPGQDFQVTPSNYQVSQFSTWFLALQVPIPMIRECYIKLDIPEDFELRPQQITALGIFTPASLVQTLSTTDYFLTAATPLFRKSSIIFKGCNDLASLGQEPTGDIQFSEISVQKGRFNSDYFGIQIYKDEEMKQLIAYLDKGGVMIPGDLIKTGPVYNIAVYPTLNQVVQQETYMMINFTISSILTWGSKVEIKMPSGFKLPPVGSVVEVIGLQQTSPATLGSILAGNVVEVQELVMNDGPRLAGYTFQLAINNVTNQFSSKNAGSIEITTFYFQNSSQKYFEVDFGKNDTTFTAKPGDISGNGIAIVIGEPKNSATQTTYKLTLTGQSLLPAGGYYIVEIPIEVDIDEESILIGGTCDKKYQGVWNSCVYLPSSRSLRIQSVTGYAAGVDVVIIVSGLTNQRSKQPTSSFVVASIDTDGVSRIDQGYNQNIQNSIAAAVSDFNVQPTSVYNGDITVYTFTIKTKTTLFIGDVISFEAPSQITMPKTNSTNLCIASDPSQSVFCDVSGQNVLVTYQSGANVTTLSWSMLNVTNPPSVRTSAGFSKISISDAKSYLVSEFEGMSEGVTNLLPANITVSSLYQESLIYSTATNFTIRFTPINIIPREGSFTLTYPPQITLNNGANTVCLVTTNRVFLKNCVIDTATSTIIIRDVFNASNAFSAQVAIQLQNITNSPDNSFTKGFTIKTFADKEQLYIEDTLKDGILIPQLTCNYPCMTCSNSSRSDCQTCWQTSPNIFLIFRMPYSNANGQCKAKCDFGYTSNGAASKQCQTCDQSCNGCNDNGLIGDASKCLTCAPDFPYSLDGTQTCLSSCGQGLYESSKFNCSACSSKCLSCSGSADFCTGCDQSSKIPNLYKNQCIGTCPPGFVSIGGLCTPCLSPCKTCSGTTSICLTCDGSQGRKINLQGTCVTKCPTGTVVNYVESKDQSECLGCNAGCANCDNKNTSICLVCNDGLVLVEGNCQSACPAGFVLQGDGCISQALVDLGIMYFPFLIMAAILTIIVLFGKCKKKGQLLHGRAKMISLQNTLTSELVFIALIQVLCNISLFILAFVFKYYLLCIISLIAAGINLVISLAYQSFFWKNTIGPICSRNKKTQSMLQMKDQTFKDKLFKEYFAKHTYSAIIIMGLTATVNIKFTKMFYSHFYSFDLFKARFTDDTLYIKTMNKFIIISFFAVDLLMIIVGFIGLATVQWNSQVYIECIEVILLSVLSAVLTGIETCKLDNILSYIRRKQMLDQNFGLNSSIVKLKLSTKYGHRIVAKTQELLLVEFGGKRCRSCVIYDKNEFDLREINSWPSSPTTRFKLKVNATDINNGVNSLSKDGDNVYHDVYQKLKGKDRGTQGNASLVDWQEALNRKHGDLMTQIDIDEEMRIRKGARRRGRKNKYYNQIDAEDDEEVDYEEASDKDADLQIIKEQEEEEEMLRQIVATETQKQVQLIAARKNKLVQELSTKETEEKAHAEARRLKLMLEDERRREKELAEGLKQDKEIQARKILQEEAALESARRASEEQIKTQSALLANQQAKIEYEAQETKVKQALEVENARLLAEEAARVAAEIAAQNLARQQNLEALHREREANDAKLAEQKRLAQEEENRLRALEKETLKQKKEREDAERKAAELAKKQKELEDLRLIEEEAKAMKEKAKKDESDQKEAQRALKLAEKNAAEALKLQKELDYLRIQDEKNKQHDADKAAKLATQVPPRPKSQVSQTVPKQKAESLPEAASSVIKKISELGLSEQPIDEFTENQAQADNLMGQKKKSFDLREALPEAASSKIRKEPTPTRAIEKPIVTDRALSEQPNDEVYQASGNEKSLRNMLSHNKSDDLNSSMIAMNDNVLKDFSKKPQGQVQGQVDIPPNAELRTFNEHDVLGDLDRDDKANLVSYEINGRYEDKKGDLVNMRGYLIDPKTGDVVDTFNRLPMFPATDLDERGELPAPFCIEKFNFNPHNLIGYFDYSDGQPQLLQTSKGYAVDKMGRRVNKKGWLCLGSVGHLIDKWGRKRFDKKQLMTDNDLPKLFTYAGKRFDVKDTIGVFDRDQADNILVQKHSSGYLMDNLGRRVNPKGYLIDESGNIVDVSGKQLFEVTDLLSHEYPKIFPFTKFNIQKVQGEFNLNPNGTPQLLKQKNGAFADRLGRLVNHKGYLIDSRNNVVDIVGNLVFNRQLLTSDGEIPQVFRAGLLRSDTASSLSRLMSEIERNNQSEFDRNGYNAKQNNSNYDKFRQNDGDTSLDSQMEDTPANYNLANQRFEEREEDHPAIQEDDEGAEHYAPLSGVEDNFEIMTRQKKLRKPKKKKPKVATIEFLEPTKREKNMAGAYGGAAMGEIRRPGIKYDQNRLANSKKFRVATADEPKVRAQLAQLVGQGFDPEMSQQDKNGKPPKARMQGLVGNNTFDQDKDSSHSHQRLGQQKNVKRSEVQPSRSKGINDGDFEQMFGKDIDKFLEDSEWDIQSADQVSRNSRASSENGAREVRVKAMEKVYLKRLEANGPTDSKIKRRSELKDDSQSRSPPRRAPRMKPVVGPPRETIISFTDNPGVIHRGEILPFATKKLWE